MATSLGRLWMPLIVLVARLIRSGPTPSASISSLSILTRDLNLRVLL